MNKSAAQKINKRLHVQQVDYSILIDVGFCLKRSSADPVHKWRNVGKLKGKLKGVRLLFIGDDKIWAPNPKAQNNIQDALKGIDWQTRFRSDTVDENGWREIERITGIDVSCESLAESY